MGRLRLLWLVALGACGRIGFDPNGPGNDAANDAGSDDALPLGPFGPPIVVPPVQSSSQDYGPAISGDGRELLFSSDRGGDFDVYLATRMGDGTFGAPAEVTELSTALADYDAEPASSGLELYFISGQSPAGLRRATRTTALQPWGNIEVIGLGAGCEGPSLGVGDLHMLIESNGDIGEWTRPSTTSAAWQQVRLHTSLAGMTWPALGPDGLEVFAVRKSDFQLFRAVRGSVDDPFEPAQRYLFGTAFDNARIYDPELSSDGRTLYLSSNVGGSPDIYVTTR
jgi:hypothetical protein